MYWIKLLSGRRVNIEHITNIEAPDAFGKALLEFSSGQTYVASKEEAEQLIELIDSIGCGPLAQAADRQKKVAATIRKATSRDTDKLIEARS